MRKFLFTAATLSVAILLLENCPAQQTPGPASQPASAGVGSPAPKPATTADVKNTPAPSLPAQRDKLSYAIGMKVGHGLKQDSVDIDPNLLLRGLEDAMSGGTTQLTEGEAQALLSDLSAQIGAKRQAEAKRLGEANQQAGQQFLAANQAKEGVVTLPSGLQYKILKQGTGPKPTATDTILCNYRGTLLDGTEFDSSYKLGHPATFVVGQVIKGWTEALQLMPVGSKWQLFIPAELAYGDHSPFPAIGPNSTLIFEVDLLSINEKKP